MNYSPSHFPRPRRACQLAGLIALALSGAGCAPTVNLSTPKPIVVDVAVKLDVYQKTAPTQVKNQQSSLQVSADRRLRSGEIQQLKNDRLVGEDRSGYLKLLKDPTDPKYLAYAQKVVADENADRAFLYSSSAQTQNKPLELVERDYAQLWRERAFPGEWVQKEDGTWIQK